MAAGLAVLDVIDEDGLQENARKVGGRLVRGFGGCRSGIRWSARFAGWASCSGWSW